MSTELPALWPPQSNAIRLTTDALADGQKRICLCLPTGGGKSRIACELIRDWLHVGYKVSLYTNRKMLLEQLAKTLKAFGLAHGTRSADAIEHGKMPSDDPLQISSIQTEASRVLKKKVWQLHEADRVIVDEAHIQSADTAQTLLNMHLERGGSYIGLTATPLELGHMYDHLIIAGTNSELRECGALVPARHYGCEEPDTSKVRKSTVEMSENDVRKIFNVQHVVGHILKNFHALNPHQKPTIGFAPDVASSIWLCENFTRCGIEAAHIDGESCIYKGERIDSDQEVRDEIMRAWKAGEVKVVWNRFVLREGIDAPHIECMILATIFNSLQSYLQSVGRGLRACPSTGKTHLKIIDHGGNWWRHGSVNIDRQWDLELTERMVNGMRLREKKDREPMRCPKCGMVVMTNKCPCGFEIKQKSRPVIMEDGQIREHHGDIFRPKFTKSDPNARELWEKMYWRSMKYKKGRSFKQAMGLYCYENGFYPDRSFPFMPTDESDLYRKVDQVPRERLTS